jgi:hypothetical protein
VIALGYPKYRHDGFIVVPEIPEEVLMGGGKSVDVVPEGLEFDIDAWSHIYTSLISTSDIAVDTENIQIKNKFEITEDSKPLKTESRFGITKDSGTLETQSQFAITEPIEFKIPQPLKTDIGLDVQPMVMDFCFKFDFGKLPPTCIRRPYQHHLGLTLFGLELFGFNLSGESRMIIGDVKKQPEVVWGGDYKTHPKGEQSSTSPKGDNSLHIRL